MKFSNIIFIIGILTILFRYDASAEEMNILSYYATENYIDGQIYTNRTNLLYFYPIFSLRHSVTSVTVDIKHSNQSLYSRPAEAIGKDKKVFSVKLPDFELGESILRLDVTVKCNLRKLLLTKHYVEDINDFKNKLEIAKSKYGELSNILNSDCELIDHKQEELLVLARLFDRNNDKFKNFIKDDKISYPEVIEQLTSYDIDIKEINDFNDLTKFLSFLTGEEIETLDISPDKIIEGYQQLLGKQSNYKIEFESNLINLKQSINNEYIWGLRSNNNINKIDNFDYFQFLEMIQTNHSSFKAENDIIFLQLKHVLKLDSNYKFKKEQIDELYRVSKLLSSKNSISAEMGNESTEGSEPSEDDDKTEYWAIKNSKLSKKLKDRISEIVKAMDADTILKSINSEIKTYNQNKEEMKKRDHQIEMLDELYSIYNNWSFIDINLQSYKEKFPQLLNFINDKVNKDINRNIISNYLEQKTRKRNEAIKAIESVVEFNNSASKINLVCPKAILGYYKSSSDTLLQAFGYIICLNDQYRLYENSKSGIGKTINDEKLKIETYGSNLDSLSKAILEVLYATLSDSNYTGSSIKKSDIVFDPDYENVNILYRLQCFGLRRQQAFDPTEKMGLLRARYIPFPITGTPNRGSLHLIDFSGLQNPAVFEISLNMGNINVPSTLFFADEMSFSRLNIAFAFNENTFTDDEDIKALLFAYDFNSYTTVGFGFNFAKDINKPYISIGINQQVFKNIILAIPKILE